MLEILSKQPRLVNVRAHGRQPGIQEKSMEHSEEHREASNVVVPHNTASIELNQQNLSHIDPSSNFLVARDGTKWTHYWNKLKRQTFEAKTS